MMTSRAEYRLTLRQDNADLRLTKKGYAIGLVTQERYDLTLKKEELINKELERLNKVIITPTEKTNNTLSELDSSPLKNAVSLYDFIKRPEISYENSVVFDPDREDLLKEIRLQVETHIKYEGYIKKQMIQIEQFKKLENRALDAELDYSKVRGLSNEALQKLTKIKPESVGQASRISGVSPSDINVLLIYLEQRRRGANLV